MLGSGDERFHPGAALEHVLRRRFGKASFRAHGVHPFPSGSCARLSYGCVYCLLLLGVKLWRAVALPLLWLLCSHLVGGLELSPSSGVHRPAEDATVPLQPHGTPARKGDETVSSNEPEQR